jgi:hypothetical protein
MDEVRIVGYGIGIGGAILAKTIGGLWVYRLIKRGEKEQVALEAADRELRASRRHEIPPDMPPPPRI